jgi:DNA-binding PadR family transcriptional regulator
VPRPPNASAQTRLVLQGLLEDPEAWHYGYALSQRTGLRSGTLYPILMRLAECGWLETSWAAPERPGSPPRHLYRLTAEGMAAATAAQAAEVTLARPALRPRRDSAGA